MDGIQTLLPWEIAMNATSQSDNSKGVWGQHVMSHDGRGSRENFYCHHVVNKWFIFGAYFGIILQNILKERKFIAINYLFDTEIKFDRESV